MQSKRAKYSPIKTPTAFFSGNSSLGTLPPR